MTQSSPSGHYPDGEPIPLSVQPLVFMFFVFFVSFSDAKKKLRLALCSADSVALPIMTPSTTRNGLPDHMESEGGKRLWFTKSLCDESDLCTVEGGTPRLHSGAAIGAFQSLCQPPMEQATGLYC